MTTRTSDTQTQTHKTHHGENEFLSRGAVPVLHDDQPGSTCKTSRTRKRTCLRRGQIPPTASISCMPDSDTALKSGSLSTRRLTTTEFRHPNVQGSTPRQPLNAQTNAARSQRYRPQARISGCLRALAAASSTENPSDDMRAKTTAATASSRSSAAGSTASPSFWYR